MAGAPPWGLAIYNALIGIQEQMAGVQGQMGLRDQFKLLRARTFNVSADRADDIIQWPQHGAVPLPAAPSTVEELRSLGLEPCETLLAYYGLPVSDTVEVCRYALARHIGVPCDLL